MFGMVLQDTWLFNGTIMENIRYGRSDATDEEVIAAAKAAHVDHFVRTLPDGYNMVLNEETTNISQGQKQLLTIARAILADPHDPDPGRSHQLGGHPHRGADPESHGRPDEGPHQLHHRPPPLHHPRRRLILVMNDGDIVEQGKHEELLAQNGFYAELYNSQFEGKAI